jgi:hypothetical protein
MHFYTPNEKLIPKSIILPRHNIPKFIRKNLRQDKSPEKTKKAQRFQNEKIS